MLDSTLPTLNRIARRLGLSRTYAQLSERSWTLAQGCTRVEPPSLFDEADLQRITGYGVDGSPEVEALRMRGGPTEHGPARAYLLRDVRLMNGHLFRAGMTLHLRDARTPWIGERPEAVRDHAVLACTQYGCRFFGHWLADDLPLRLAAQELGTPIACKQALTPHQHEYASRLGLEVDAIGPTHFRELIVIDDRGQNADRRERMQTLRERLHGGALAKRHAGVMLWRGSTGHARQLTNEAAVAQRLRERGFTIVRPEEQSFDELAEACAGARVVVGVEGSQLAHGLYGVAPAGAVVALQPPHRFGNVFKVYADNLGLRYGFVVGHAEPGGSFRIDVDQLDRLLDRIDAMQATLN